MTEKLPYWAERYVLHMQQYLPKTCAALQALSELEPMALYVQEQASSYYHQRREYYKSLGGSDIQADIQAEIDTKCEYILHLPEEKSFESRDEDFGLFKNKLL